LRNLIDETLQIQEAKNADIKIDEGEVEGTYARVAQENFKQEPAALDAYLARIGSSPNSLKRQIRGEMAWNRVLRRNVQPFVNVSQQEVKELLERMKASKGTEEYRLGEIYLSATPDSRSIVAENAQRIMTQLKEGGSFAAYARQYSEASTKAVGGDLGWIRLAQLPTELAASAREMQTGQLVGPIEMRGGFSILYLIDKRQVLTADPRDAVLALKQITLTCPPASRKPTRTKRSTNSPPRSRRRRVAAVSMRWPASWAHRLLPMTRSARVICPPRCNNRCWRSRWAKPRRRLVRFRKASVC
jgi:peptidyl-prolyl cis-trans isomerase SurA